MTVGMSRRGLFGVVGLAAAAVASPVLLAGCRSEGSGKAASNPSKAADGVLPSYKLKEYVTPDFPAPANGFSKIPDKLVKAFDKPPGSGSTFTVMTPLWGAIPSSSGNKYFEGVNAALGSTLKFQISDGNTYADKLATVLADQKGLPDWISLNTWSIPARFGDTATSLFADLGPYLSGDKALDYPHLASVPTDVWRYCVWNGTLIGLPMPDAGIPNPLFYRADLFEELGATVPKTPDEVLEVAKQLTDAKMGRYGAEDLWNQAQNFFAVPSKWRLGDADALLHKVETDEYKQALEWTAKLFKSGAVHPDAVAGNTGDTKTRFESGKSLMMSDGIGGWAEALQRQLPSNPKYNQQPLPVIGNGSGGPVVWKGPALGIFSCIKKGTSEDKIKEILTIADFLAAPFGTEEFQLVNYGVEGTHWTKGANGLPEMTKLGSTEVQPTYVFLADPPVVQAKVQYPNYVKDVSTWINDTAKYFKDPLFYGMNIVEPTQYASISKPFEDLEKDIARGRKTMADLDKAIATWKKSGGDQLRDFYQKILDETKSK